LRDYLDFRYFEDQYFRAMEDCVLREGLGARHGGGWRRLDKRDEYTHLYGSTVLVSLYRDSVSESERDKQMLQGIQFVTNAAGEKTAVLIDLKQYGDLWEDFYDVLIARQRADEPRESLDSVRQALERQEKLSG
jgi:hypothetical protein